MVTLRRPQCPHDSLEPTAGSSLCRVHPAVLLSRPLTPGSRASIATHASVARLSGQSLHHSRLTSLVPRWHRPHLPSDGQRHGPPARPEDPRHCAATENSPVLLPLVDKSLPSQHRRHCTWPCEWDTRPQHVHCLGALRRRSVLSVVLGAVLSLFRSLPFMALTSGPTGFLFSA